jgi:glycosyltransferase involved in cell wall biosynthesis
MNTNHHTPKQDDRQLNIAVDVRPLSTPKGGISRYTSSLLREIAKQQLPHNIFLYSDWPFECDFELPAHWRIRHSPRRLRGLSTAFAQTVFPIWAIRDRIDVFWATRNHLPVFLAPGIRKTLTVHDAVWKRFPETMKGWGRAVDAFLIPLSIRLADHIIAISRFTRSELIALFPEAEPRVYVVYEASNLKGPEPAGPSLLPTDYFLFVGSSEPRKNIGKLLEAYAQYLESSEHPFDMVVVGADEWGDISVSRLAEQLGLGAHLHLMRNVDDDSLCSLYANARACILVSFYEGFGLPLVEAMQWGTPLIVSNRSALPEIAGEAGIYVDPDDIGSIAHALHRMTDEIETHAELARLARIRGQQFSWEKAAAETLALLSRHCR